MFRTTGGRFGSKKRKMGKDELKEQWLPSWLNKGFHKRVKQCISEITSQLKKNEFQHKAKSKNIQPTMKCWTTVALP